MNGIRIGCRLSAVAVLLFLASACGNPQGETAVGDIQADTTRETSDADADMAGREAESPDASRCTPCAPQCDGKECGDDGCGGLCGQCTWDGPFYCSYDTCVWADWGDCSMKNCGYDGMGGTCGMCPAGWNCREDGVCQPDAGGCAGIPVGGLCLNGAVVTCVEGKARAQPCPYDNCKGGVDFKAAFCEVPCLENCFGRECGRDGCAGSCGECEAGWTCRSGVCVPVTGCGPFDEKTVCRGHFALTCRYGVVEVADCLASMQVCGPDPCDGDERCHPVWPGQSCEGLPAWGVCVGSGFLSCPGGELQLQRCDASQGATCGRRRLNSFGCE